MSGFTPGPWRMKAEYSMVYIEANARDPRLTQEVAAVGPKEGGREQQEADARLIASAPDLLESAIAFLGNATVSSKSGLALKAAIAKATGNE